MATGWVWHEQYMWHDTGSGAGARSAGGYIEPAQHLENPSAKRRLRNLVEVSGLLEHLTPLPAAAATRAEAGAVHAAPYLDRLERLSDATGGNAGENAPFGPGSFDIALLAAGGAITAATAVATGTVNNAYALIRPPGHHAEYDRGRGFCLINNIAIATQALINRGLARRVAVLDWDVHHGNGTQSLFYDRDDVLTVSLHQDRLFPPDGGGAGERGAGIGWGANINIPLPPGSGEPAYLAALDEVALPALRRFGPDLIIVACGYDASALDPLGRMLLRSHSFRAMTRLLLDGSCDLNDGRVVFCHEGGYSEAYVSFCGLAVLEELCSVRTQVADPYFPPDRYIAGDELRPDQAAVIAEAAGRMADAPAAPPHTMTPDQADR
jgi:acetoin utilization deacetylase AcuC-like enzyme